MPDVNERYDVNLGEVTMIVLSPEEAEREPLTALKLNELIAAEVRHDCW